VEDIDLSMFLKQLLPDKLHHVKENTRDATTGNFNGP